jgi:hypothetical protein
MTMGRDGNRAKWEGAKWEEGEMAKGRNGNVIWAKWEKAKWERAKWEDTTVWYWYLEMTTSLTDYGGKVDWR